MMSLVMASAPISILVLTAVSVALYVATRSISKESWVLKHVSHGLFAVWQGLVLSPLALISSSAFALASGGALVLTGGLGVLSMVLKESFEKYETILLVALGVIATASIGACLLSGAAASFASGVSLIGGFAVFGCLVIYDTHVVRSHVFDPNFDEINHSMGIYMDVLNILIRLWEIIYKK